MVSSETSRHNLTQIVYKQLLDKQVIGNQVSITDAWISLKTSIELCMSKVEFPNSHGHGALYNENIFSLQTWLNCLW